VIDNTLLRFAPLAGLLVGCYFAGWLCDEKIELGIVPFGAAGLAIFLLLGAYVPGNVYLFQIKT